MKTLVKLMLLVMMQVSVIIVTTHFLFPEESSNYDGRFVQQAINQAPTENFSQNEKFNFKLNKEFTFGYDVNSFIIINATCSFVIIFGIITLLKTETKKKIQIEKLAIVGELASRIRHDVRNPLSIIQITIENIKVQYNLNENQKIQFEKIQRAIFRITHQMDDVLEFIKEPNVKKKQCLLLSILQDSVKRIPIPNNIEVQFPSNDCHLFCDDEKMIIVFVNIILNAIQSLENGGTIRISFDSNKKWIIIKIEDDGSGIGNKILDRVFDPLITTKQEGTGLGLSCCRSIMKSHGGFIKASNKHEKGAVFSIYLPK